MWNASSADEKNKLIEHHQFIAEEKLHQIGDYLEEYTYLTNKNLDKYTNILNIYPKPILVDENFHERIPVVNLTYSDNGIILSRILNTLVGLCKEIENLKQEAEKLYSPFLYFEIDQNEHILQSITKILEPLQKTEILLNRIKEVILATLHQLCEILNKGYYISSNIPSFSEVLSSFSQLLICLIKFDALFDSPVLKNNWLTYRRTLRNLLHKNSTLGFNRDELRSFNNRLITLENLISGSLLKETIEACLESKIMIDIKKSTLNIEFYNSIMNWFSEYEKDENSCYRDVGIQLNVLVTYYLILFNNSDKKIIKKLLEFNKKISTYTLLGNILWYPERFLLKHVNTIGKFIDEKSIENYRLNEINSRILNLPKETNRLCSQASLFLLQLDNKRNNLDIKSLKLEELKNINNLLFDGLKLVRKINWIIKWIMNIHLDKSIQVTKSTLNCISKLVEILKCISISMQRNMIFLNFINLFISQHLQHLALSHLEVLKKNHTQSKSYKHQQLDILSALKVCENALKGPNTKWRNLVANLGLSASGLNSNLIDIKNVLNQLNIYSNFTNYFNEFCDCSVLYWHLNYIIPVYFSKLIASKSNISKCCAFLMVINDCEKASNNKELTKEINKIIYEKLYSPLTQIIETNLRHQTHLHLQLPHLDPFENYFSTNFDKLLPIILNNSYKSIKNDTEHALSTTFYNLTTVVLHDWKTYGEMRQLASLQYNLKTVDDDLPMQSLGFGLDVLEIMRNIHIFVEKYLYNLNSQIFIEARSNNKHLNSINILHVANSIRSHGIGIMNTTVNYTYQFLKNKFRIFSQFLFDEQIKSRLLKDLKHFNNNKNDLNQMYPYEKAEKFNKGIRKLGSLNGGESYLDLFRKVITHIGNTMGYIRLIRSGGNRCLAEGTCFIPDLKSTDFFRELVEQEDENITELTRNSLKNLDKNIKNFIEIFGNNMEYFQLLVQVFIPHFRNPNNIHLNNFYIIIPPLTINFIEYLLTCKERIFKKDKTDCAFTDDGFALGLAYIIELLDQEHQLSSLHWFESVQRKFKKDKENVLEQIKNSNNDDIKLRQALSLSVKRIDSFIQEFKLLEYNYTSSRSFYR